MNDPVGYQSLLVDQLNTAKQINKNMTKACQVLHDNIDALRSENTALRWLCLILTIIMCLTTGVLLS